MLKTSSLGPMIAAMLFACATNTLAGTVSGAAAIAHPQAPGAVTALGDWEGHHMATAGMPGLGEGDMAPAVPGPWDAGAVGPDHYGADGARAAGDFVGASKLANLNPDAEAEALPLSQFAGAHAKPAAGHGAAAVWDIVNRVRYGRLPEPASWALMLIGFGMIGAALRGFVVANRRLARLQPEDGDTG